MRTTSVQQRQQFNPGGNVKYREALGRSLYASQRHFLIMLGMVLVLVGLLLGMGLLINIRPPSADLVIEALRAHVQPEPVERTVFAFLAALVPVIVVGTSFFAPAAAPREGSYRDLMVPLGLGALLLWLFVGSDFVATLAGLYGTQIGARGIVAAMVLALSVATVLCAGLARLPGTRLAGLPRIPQLPMSLAWGVFLCGVLLQVLGWRWVSINAVTRSGVWSTHADPVFYALSQVVAGKTLLADLPSQYGFFPEILAPLFKITRLSVQSLTTVFALMQLLSMAALFEVLRQRLRSRWLLVLVGMALTLVSYEAVLIFVGIDERYFQYWPVRFFWPAISVLAFHRFACHPGLARAACVSLVGAIGLMWNFDSGLFIVVAFTAYLLAQWILTRWVLGAENARLPHNMVNRALANHIVLTIAVIGLFMAALEVKSMGRIDWRAAFAYQGIFLDLGLMMLPLPRQPHPWMAILTAYLAGMVIAARSWYVRGATAKADTLFFVSLLGLGLFTYYLGRSHVLNLVTVCWPALIVAVLIADESCRVVRCRAASPAYLAVPIVVVALSACSSA
jgi:hypothetical protein